MQQPLNQYHDYNYICNARSSANHSSVKEKWAENRSYYDQKTTTGDRINPEDHKQYRTCVLID